MEQTAIAVRRELTPDLFNMTLALAPTMYDARLFGVASPAQATAIMVKGYELGFSLSASFEFISVIQGRPVLTPKGMMALILNSPEYHSHSITDEKDSRGNPVACSVWMKRRNGFRYELRFTLDDAKRAGLIKKDGAWETYPANMLRWRAVGYCADQVFPDVIGGMKRADEFGAAVSIEGDVIEGTWTESPQTPQEPPEQPEMDPPYGLVDLLADFPSGDILAANGNKLPATDADIRRIREELTMGRVA